MTTAVLSRPEPCRSFRPTPLLNRCAVAMGPTEEQRTRAQRLLTQEISFIPHASFEEDHTDDASPDLWASACEPSSEGIRRVPRDLPGHLARLCEAQLLTANEERELFHQMNLLKFRAHRIQQTLSLLHLDVKALDEAERCLAAAKTIRDRIVQGNMRLVISVVKKYVTPQHSFDDLLSEGIMTLMVAVDKFDYDRGFRFSTYAYRAISRNVYRAITDQQKESRRFTCGGEERLDTEDQRGASTLDERTWESLRGMLGQMLDRLDRRERFILSGRYALGAHREVRTFQALADKLGLSKERVRQLEQRALAKLREMAAQLQMDDALDNTVTTN